MTEADRTTEELPAERVLIDSAGSEPRTIQLSWLPLTLYLTLDDIQCHTVVGRAYKPRGETNDDEWEETRSIHAGASLDNTETHLFPLLKDGTRGNRIRDLGVHLFVRPDAPRMSEAVFGRPSVPIPHSQLFHGLAQPRSRDTIAIPEFTELYLSIPAPQFNAIWSDLKLAHGPASIRAEVEIAAYSDVVPACYYINADANWPASVASLTLRRSPPQMPATTTEAAPPATASETSERAAPNFESAISRLEGRLVAIDKRIILLIVLLGIYAAYRVFVGS